MDAMYRNTSPFEFPNPSQFAWGILVNDIFQEIIKHPFILSALFISAFCVWLTRKLNQKTVNREHPNRLDEKKVDSAPHPYHWAVAWSERNTNSSLIVSQTFKKNWPRWSHTSHSVSWFQPYQALVSSTRPLSTVRLVTVHNLTMPESLRYGWA